jgi:hypothetical protein
MRNSFVRMIITNLLLFVLTVVPVWYVVATLQGRLAAPNGQESLSVGGAVFLSFAYVPYMLPGWVAQQILLIAAHNRFRPPFGRIIALASAALLAASLLLLYPGVTRSQGVWSSLAPGLLVYGALCRYRMGAERSRVGVGEAART